MCKHNISHHNTPHHITLHHLMPKCVKSRKATSHHNTAQHITEQHVTSTTWHDNRLYSTALQHVISHYTTFVFSRALHGSHLVLIWWVSCTSQQTGMQWCHMTSDHFAPQHITSQHSTIHYIRHIILHQIHQITTHHNTTPWIALHKVIFDYTTVHHVATQYVLMHYIALGYTTSHSGTTAHNTWH